MDNFKNIYILIAEDDDGEIICESFVKHDAIGKVDLVKNGKGLLDFLRNTENKKPDVILTDINMPLINGMEALEEMSTDKELVEIPVFVYSSTINPVYQAKCKQLGALGYLVKPFSLAAFDEIPSQLIQILEKRKNL
jgi:CheY-like chemotaxis protein